MMEYERWAQLERHGGSLTEQEKEDGWMFCCDWDYMLICKDQEEAKFCSCLAKKRLKGEIE